MPDQYLGPKGKYVYITDDDTTNLIITRDKTLATLAGTGLTEFDPATPPANSSPKPAGYKLRGVYWQSDAPVGEGGFARKFIVCGDRNGALYDSNVTQALEIDGIAGRTTGRRGEQVSFI